jgi:hypothetical protein
VLEGSAIYEAMTPILRACEPMLNMATATRIPHAIIQLLAVGAAKTTQRFLFPAECRGNRGGVVQTPKHMLRS